MFFKRKIITVLSVIMIVLFSVPVVSVSATAAGVKISKSHYSVQIGSTLKIDAIGSNLIWSSSDPSVVTVSQLGVVKGISMGKATITAKSGSYSASCEISCGFYKGIDVSSWNGEYSQSGAYLGPVDWKKVKSQGIDFAFLRAGYGWEDYPYQVDNQLSHNIKGCLENDIPFGLYFYSYATNGYEAVLEAKYLLRILNDYLPDAKTKMKLPIAYDIEEEFIYTMSSSQLTDIAVSFCNVLKAEGYDTMIYGNTASFNIMNLETLQKNDIGFWYAMWPYTPQFKEHETIGKTDIVPDVWQYASDGSVPGAGTTDGVDMNVIYMLSSNTDLFKDTATTAQVTKPGSGTAKLSWNSVALAQYNLYRANVSSAGKIDTANASKLYSGGKTTFTDGSMRYGKSYYYYTDTSFSGDLIDPDYRKIVSGVEKGAYVYNVYKGDVSLNGKLDLIDAILIQKYVNSQNTLSDIQKFAADYDSSSSIKLADAMLVQKAAQSSNN